MKKIHYNKLIRDKLPEIMRRAGAAFSLKELNRKDFEKSLIRKVQEEASGLIKARSRKNLIEELADVIDVIEEIKKLKKIKPAEISKARALNRRIKGGFNKRLWLAWSEDTGYKTNELRYPRR